MITLAWIFPYISETMEGMMERKNRYPLEFHISRQAREKYRFDQMLFASNGNVIFANFYAARLFAQKINQYRDLVNFPEQTMRAGQINAMGLIDEILHIVVGLYRQIINPIVMEQALEWLYEHIGEKKVQETLAVFSEEFPPMAVHRQEISPEDYLQGSSQLITADGKVVVVPNRQIVLEEMLLLRMANLNPAFRPHRELFDDNRLERRTEYRQLMDSLVRFFDFQPPFGPDAQTLVDMLRSPIVAAPHSLSGQLEYIRERWGHLLGGHLYRLLTSLDLIQEEEKAIFLGPGPSIPYDFSGLELETEQFSPDKEWMPSVVLIAKNVYVWLDQLSKKYRKDITSLDQIPDEELDILSSWGINGLWLIGLWERSKASKRIKQLRGKLEAEASAYSLFDYQIAADLGGDQAYQNLHDRAWERGIRLASDMVPNHMGIDSKWVIEHPDWFLSLDYSPFPSYSFNGPDLSWDERVGIFLEDHYYEGTDAAVVFKRIDRWTGTERFIYHGNDGTSMPWNDTAQLNYLLADVRQAVIQTILHVARKFPIIRFDAAMTLAKKHYQRLWFPEPGTGGAIPTRSDHGLTKQEFDAAMPKEFWREVVEAVAQEAPDTLLLAEAFWLMEGYFVRSLGMHRVYNSAFMNMLRDEKNQEYRLVIKNTLEFEPEILKRYVNFMSNPDEETAVAQFGKGDKYFGICTLMATMPGLPMFGHGQVEGYTEKYGMEFRQAYWDEQVDTTLVERHTRQIFPLLRRRYLFAEVKEFLLFDFFSPDGTVNEDVFAYTNRAGEERSLVIYHNRYAQANGWLRTSASYPVKNAGDGERKLIQKTLGEGLGLVNEPEVYTIFKDHITGLEYIRNNMEIHERGLYVELEAYKAHVFLNLQQVKDDDRHHYAQLMDYLNGRGVPSIAEALDELFLKPVHEAFRSLVNADFYKQLLDGRITKRSEQVDDDLLRDFEARLRQLLFEIRSHLQIESEERRIMDIVRSISRRMEALMSLPGMEVEGSSTQQSMLREARGLISSHLGDDPGRWAVLFSWLIVQPSGEVVSEEGAFERSRSWIDEWMLGRILSQTFQSLGGDEGSSWWGVATVKILTAHGNWYDIVDKDEEKAKGDYKAYSVVEGWLRDEEIQRYLQVNRYQDILWFNKEAFNELILWMLAPLMIEWIKSTEIDQEASTLNFHKSYAILRRMRQAAEESDYMVEKLLDALDE
jgi:glycosidase